MENKDFAQSNKMIAEFLQWSKDGYGVYAKPFNSIIPDDPTEYRSSMRYIPTDMRFHTSWEWLMPVVEKIGTINDDKRNTELWGNIALALQAVDRDWIYRGVVDYINWISLRLEKKGERG